MEPAPDPATVPPEPSFRQVLDELTRLPAQRPAPTAARFVLQFSTGETYTVEGTGLIGRRPSEQPGENYDLLISLNDQGRSISKTHLEFGQEGGVFWISDRYSANGTVVREPDRPPRLSAPGMRSRVARGSRVEIGEQFFVVS
ncbi:FHA domain-containing protein [Naasia lichenicola]|nr:FHA domain-containing protein [Naasia lichenicola]